MTAVKTDQLVSGFIDLSLPKSAWTHQAHLRVGLWHAMHHSPVETLELLRDRISAFNQAKGVANTESAGYHETITRFYVHVIGLFLASADTRRPIDELEQELIDRYGDKELPLRYYTRERLFSTAARLGWVAPDLLALPSGR
jgi:hypothetical protein